MDNRMITRKPPPTMLKEFLRDDFSSCSSSGFKTYPRRQSCYLSMRNLLEMDLKTKEMDLPKSNFFKKASVAVITAVKSLHSAQKQSVLSNSLSKSLSKRLKRGFSKSRSGGEEMVKHEITVVVKVKDILRWKSFAAKGLGCSGSPIQTSITNTTTTTTTTTTTSSNSWTDSDFTSDYFGSSEYSGENESEDGKKSFTEKKKKVSKRRGDEVVEDSMEKTHGDSKYEEKDQFSPVSVMDFPYEEDDESSSSFQSSLENMEKTKHKLMQKIRRFESLAKIEPLFLENRIASHEMDEEQEEDECNSNEKKTYKELHHHDEEYIRAEEKAIELLKAFNSTKPTITTIKECFHQDTTNDLLLDFFRDEILETNITNNLPRKDGLKCELLKVTKDWMDGNNVLLDWKVQESRKVHIKEMERGGIWRDVEADKKELVVELEVGVLNFLIDEILSDLIS